MKPQFITDSKGKKTGVLLTMKSYKKMIEELEDYEDAIDAYKIASDKNTKYYTMAEIEKELNLGNNGNIYTHRQQTSKKISTKASSLSV